MLSVVHSSDCSKLEFIQPHSKFVAGGGIGCLDPNRPGKFSEALARGEPNRMQIALTAASDTVRQII